MILPIEKATEIFNNKMSRPQYKDYQGNEPLQQLLFDDCLKEAIASREICGVAND